MLTFSFAHLSILQRMTSTSALLRMLVMLRIQMLIFVWQYSAALNISIHAEMLS